MLQLTTPEPSTALESLKVLIDDDALLETIEDKVISVTQSDAESHTPNLSATFSKDTLTKLSKVNQCTGIRLYPAIKDGELMLVAGSVKSNNDDITNIEDSCGCGYSTPAESHISRLSDSQGFIFSEDIPEEEDVKQKLRILQNVGNSDKKFKAYFALDFLLDNMGQSNTVKFEIAELMFENEVTHRTIAATFPEDPTIHASMLPCPPNCGDGSYLNENLA